MKKTITLACMLCMSYFAFGQTYNSLWIPDTLSGTSFTLTAVDTFKQMIPGNQTITAAYNGNWMGPTMIWQKGSTVNLTVRNKLQDSTTVHWHGMHLPAVMDGGPHQIIPPNTTWSPYFKVTNNAGTYWYHPHLHMEAEKQIESGLAGMIIIRDSNESALKLPRTYGVDDVPLLLTDRKFTSSNQISTASYGDSMMVNGVLRPQFSVPAQMIRFRVLDAALERSYNLGFSDNRKFYVISSDGGLLDSPVAVTRYFISVGERLEILVDFGSQSGTSVDLMAYNSTLTQQEPGGDVFPNGPLENFLQRKDFNILHLNVIAQNSNPVTTMPTTLTSISFPDTSTVNLTRYLTISDTSAKPGAPPTFILNHKLFDFNYYNYTVPLNNTEIWEITSTSNFSHPFHIHDVQFHILSMNGSPAPAQLQGWKDVVYVKSKTTVKFIARFGDYSDSLHPFMYHCHIAAHEDAGMMGQFIVEDSKTGIENQVYLKPSYSLYPNPANDRLMLKFDNDPIDIYYITVTDIIGRTYLMLPKPRINQGIDITSLKPGNYFLNLTDNRNKKTYTSSFIKQ